MLLNLIGIAAAVAAGFGLGRSQLDARFRTVALTALMAAVLHASLKFALPHDSIEGFAQRHVYDGGGALVLVLIAALETAGLWVPVAVTRWAVFSTRSWVTLYDAWRGGPRCHRLLLPIRYQNYQWRNHGAEAPLV
jgi:hypothetical protein